MNNPDSQIVWKPLPGAQSLFLALPDDVEEVVYGGSRGSGKSEALLGLAIMHAQRFGKYARMILFRRSLPQLEEIQARCTALLPLLKATYRAASHTWCFPGGGTLKMRFLDDDRDISKYFGHEYSLIMIDDAGTFPSMTPILAMKACLRSPHGVPCRMALSAMPGNVGHSWIKARFYDPARPGTIFRGEDGTLRVMIQAKLEDNTILLEKDPGYADRLRSCGNHVRYRQWRFGDWEAIEQGALFDRAWFPRYTEVPKLSRVLMALDTAFSTHNSSDYSAAVVLGETSNAYYVLDVWRGRVAFYDLKTITQQLAVKWNPSAVLIESAASGISLIQELQRSTKLPVLPIKVEADKVTRAFVIQPTCEAGRVHVPEKAAWVDPFLDELVLFGGPGSGSGSGGGHDDQLDAFVHGLSWLIEHQQGSPLEIYPIGYSRAEEWAWLGH